jgi:phosphatidate cytidylyltransferase
MALGNLASRFLVAAVGVPIILLAIYQEVHHGIFWALIFGGSILGMYEFFAMAIPDQRDRIASAILGALTVTGFYWLGGRGGELLALFAATVPVGLYYMFRFGDMSTVAARMGTTVTGIVYAGLLLMFLAMIKRDIGGVEGGHFVVFVLAIAWVGDTGAYFAGRFLGKTKLYPAVSPGKTWAGAFGGLAASALTAVVFKLLLVEDAMWIDLILMAVPGAALGQMGDLVESMIKRSRGVKDSGSILPGHGGILDRIDAVLFIGPYVYLYIVFRPQITALF